MPAGRVDIVLGLFGSHLDPDADGGYALPANDSPGANMDISRRPATLGSLSLIARTSMSPMVRADEGFVPFDGLDEFLLATDAYIYGYPLVTMEMTRR
jgi:hypothetical protein